MKSYAMHGIPLIAALIFVALYSPLYANPYTDNGDGTVTDSRTHLRWQKCSMGQKNDPVCSGEARWVNWNEAMGYCKALRLGGRAWRLPGKDELLSIVEPGHYPAIDIASFPNTHGRTYWTSTEYSYTDAWFVGFGSGYPGSNSKTTGFDVRCVTGP